MEPQDNGHTGTDHFVHYTEVVLFQRQKFIVTILGRSSVLYRGVLYSEVSFIQRRPLFRGVLYSEVSFIQRCPLLEVPLYM